MVQLSHPYMTTGKTMTLTRQTFVSKGMSLPFNMLSRLVIIFLPRSNFMAAVTFHGDSEAPKNKICHCFHLFPHLFAIVWEYKMNIQKNESRLAENVHVLQFFPIMGSQYIWCLLILRFQTSTRVFSELVSTFISLTIPPRHELSSSWQL